MCNVVIETERLILRNWLDRDLPFFVKINQDPRVMEYFPALQNEEQSKNIIERCKQLYREKGYCLFACELKATGEFIGFVGLLDVNFEAYFIPAMEIGWRLAYEHWGKGYATEAAKSVLDYAFNTWSLQELVSFTTINNWRSRKVMEKIGMKQDPEGEFEHPLLAEGHPLRRHALYRITKDQYLNL
jgi:3-dehydroquinate dehydratase/shikimate dehydrogenase